LSWWKKPSYKGDTLTYQRLADTVDALLGRSIRRVALKVPGLKAEPANDPASSIRKYRGCLLKERA
jgi:hypothetical protein